MPKYNRAEVLVVELTLNGKDYTRDGKTYGYFVLFQSVEPRLISVDGTTVIRIKGHGFVNTTVI